MLGLVYINFTKRAFYLWGWGGVDKYAFGKIDFRVARKCKYIFPLLILTMWKLVQFTALAPGVFENNYELWFVFSTSKISAYLKFRMHISKLSQIVRFTHIHVDAYSRTASQKFRQEHTDYSKMSLLVSAVQPFNRAPNLLAPPITKNTILCDDSIRITYGNRAHFAVRLFVSRVTEICETLDRVRCANIMARNSIGCGVFKIACM